jgi:hypothetical protein
MLKFLDTDSWRRAFAHHQTAKSNRYNPVYSVLCSGPGKPAVSTARFSLADVASVLALAHRFQTLDRGLILRHDLFVGQLRDGRYAFLEARFDVSRPGRGRLASTITCTTGNPGTLASTMDKVNRLLFLGRGESVDFLDQDFLGMLEDAQMAYEARCPSEA